MSISLNVRGYDLYNRLTSAGSASFAYDPAGRLYQSAGAATARFQYDGVDLIAEYNASNVLQRRYVHGPSFDEPVVWYEGAGASDRRWLVQDQLGSVIAVTNASGDAIAINSYDEYGRPAAANQGRFQYTGQTWLSDASLYHYKARAYSPVLGRFMQTDPILYAGGMNLYEYVGSDPINRLDPLGLLCRMLVTVRVTYPDGSPDTVQSYWLEVPCNSIGAITSGSGLGRPTRSGDAGGADNMDRGEVDPNVWVPFLSVSTTNDALLDACGAAGASGLGALLAMELGPAGGFVGSELGGPIGQSICGMARQSAQQGARSVASGWDMFWANFFDFARPGGGPFPFDPLAPRE